MKRPCLLVCRRVLLAFFVIAVTAPCALAQAPSGAVPAPIPAVFAVAPSDVPASGQSSSVLVTRGHDDWAVGIYPIYAWLPFDIDLDVTIPPDDSGGDGGDGSIIDSRFDGAYLGGFYASKARFRVDADGLWAAFGGDRPERPYLKADVDATYFHATTGVRLFSDFYAIGGVRRLGLNYKIDLGDLPRFERKPGVWDPLVGVAWHSERGRWFGLHLVGEYGGFGVGTETEVGATARLDIKPFTHFGVTAGYSVLHFELEDTIRSRTFRVKQTLGGPIVGIGVYF